MAFTAKQLAVKIVLDLSSLAVLVVITGSIAIWCKPVQRGFYCGDETIRYPYHSNTISGPLLLILITLPFKVIVTVNEIYRHKNSNAMTSRYRSLCKEFYNKQFPYFYGLIWCLLCTYVAKMSTGRLRPYFMTICKPNVNCDINNLQYIEEFQCTGLDVAPAMAVKEMRFSFMSGHASTIAYAMVYLSIYLQQRVQVRSSSGRLIRSLIQGFALNLALYVGYTRVSDYWHHWNDVLVGFLQGTVTAIIIAKFVSDLFIANNNISKQLSLINNDLNTSNGNSDEYQVKLIKQTSI